MLNHIWAQNAYNQKHHSKFTKCHPPAIVLKVACLADYVIKNVLMSKYYAAVDSRNSNGSFSESFLTYKVANNTQIFSPWDEIWPWNTEKFNETALMQFATWYAVINNVLICTFHNGVRGQNTKVNISISKHGGLQAKIFILH